MSSNTSSGVDTPLFQLWSPQQRIEPTVQLEYRNPVLRRTQYRDCVHAVDPAGQCIDPAGQCIDPAVGSARDELCDTALGNTTETTENTEKPEA